jgi:hypothetical protein
VDNQFFRNIFYYKNYYLDFFEKLNPETKKKFLLKSKSDDVPHIDLPINDLVKISGPVFPVVLGTDNGMVRKKWNIITVSEDELNNFFK